MKMNSTVETFNLKRFIPSFAEKSLAIKTAHILTIIIIQIIIQNYINHFPRGIDLITPWLITTILLTPSLYICFLGIVSGFFIEVHNSLFQYQMITTYWSLLGSLLIIRKKITLNNLRTWLALVIIAHLWIFFVDIYVVFCHSFLETNNFKEISINFIVRIIISTIIVISNKKHIISTIPNEK
jgi:hypothetical protein